MSVCPFCGCEVLDGVCPQCGKPLSESELLAKARAHLKQMDDGRAVQDEWGFSVDPDQWQNKKEQKFDVFEEQEYHERERVILPLLRKNLTVILTAVVVAAVFAAFEIIFRSGP